MATTRPHHARSNDRAGNHQKKSRHGALHHDGRVTGQRGAEQRRDPTASLNLQNILLGSGLDITDVPVTLNLETPVFDRVRPVFLSLLEHEVLPLHPPATNESLSQYLRRSLNRWADAHHDLLAATIETNNTDLHVRIFLSETVPIDIEEFHATLGDLHPRLSGSVIAHLKQKAHKTLDFFSELDALQAHHVGNPAHYWKVLRENTARALNIDPSALTNTQLRAYVDQQRYITPRKLKQQLGMQRIYALKRPMTPAQLRHTLAPYPRQLHQYECLMALADDLADLGEQLAAYLPEGHSAAQFGVILSSNEDYRNWTMLQEIYHHHLQGRRPPPLIDLKVSATQPERLGEALDTAETLLLVLQQIWEALLDWPDTLFFPKGNAHTHASQTIKP